MKWKMEKRGILWSFVAAAAILALVGWESYRYTVRVDEATEARKYSLKRSWCWMMWLPDSLTRKQVSEFMS